MVRSRTHLAAAIAVSLAGSANGLAAQTLDALRVGASPLAERRALPVLHAPSLPPECQYWIGGGMLAGATAGIVASVVTLRQTARRGGEGTLALPMLAPILVVLYVGGGAAGGALVGYVGCAAYYSVRPPSAADAPEWAPLAPAAWFATVPLPR